MFAGYAKPCTLDDFRLGAACIVQAQQQPSSTKAQMWKQAAHLYTAAIAQARVSNSTHKIIFRPNNSIIAQGCNGSSMDRTTEEQTRGGVEQCTDGPTSAPTEGAAQRNGFQAAEAR